MNPSIEILRSLISYDPMTGQLRWMKKSGIASAGSIAGLIHTGGYRRIQINGRKLMAHRIAWALYYGEWPNLHIDHIDGDKDNNRITNLRLVSDSQNQYNRGITASNKSGVKGVHQDKKSGKWLAAIRYMGSIIKVGSFDTIDEAAGAIRSKRIELHGEFANHG